MLLGLGRHAGDECTLSKRWLHALLPYEGWTDDPRGAVRRAAGVMPAAGWEEHPSGLLAGTCEPTELCYPAPGFYFMPPSSPAQEELQHPATIPAQMRWDMEGVVSFPVVAFLSWLFVCSSAHSELQLCLGLATAACNCSSSQTSVSLPQGWGWGCLGNAVGVVCLVVCSRNVGQTVKFFSPLVK